MTIIIHGKPKPKKPAVTTEAEKPKSRAEREAEERKLAEMLYPTAVAKATAEAGK